VTFEAPNGRTGTLGSAAPDVFEAAPRLAGVFVFGPPMVVLLPVFILSTIRSRNAAALKSPAARPKCKDDNIVDD